MNKYILHNYHVKNRKRILVGIEDNIKLIINV